MNAVVPLQVELKIPRSCEYVRVARKTAFALANQLSFNIHDIYDIELAIGEVCTNAVEHVNENCREILLRFSADTEQLVMEVIDQGQGFDPDKVSEPEAIDEDTSGGLGLLIARSIVDELAITCHPEAGGTCVRMVKYRAKQ